MLSQWSWAWPAIALAFLLGGLAASWYARRSGASRDVKVNAEYFKGLNYLLNEEPDKAIDVFIRALDVDDETVELHLALGGLFRRTGQVDRATRIHQNLIARTNLTENQRMQAVHELAQDYYRVGWLDRAENLFSELLESDDYRSLALAGLVSVYQQEKEWAKAIDALRKHRKKDRPAYAKQIAHYYCELAEVALKRGDYEDAGGWLRSARAERAAIGRVDYLLGELNFVQSDYRKALHYWARMRAEHAQLAHLVVGKIISAYQELGDDEALASYLKEDSNVPRDNLAFMQWHSALSQTLGEPAALELIFARVQAGGLSGPVSAYLLQAIKRHEVSTERRDGLLIELLTRAKSRKIEYTCVGCGFDTKAMYWFCPNCGRWESFH
ncbi:tetratricopeptide repeat protein [Arenicella xantha]|uniref:Lipopolysaccharide biosynthesis regulator YciM n=1 Tax=Arenicella xantha TaxID=644221 RepID=A0A395JL26_9GAMM|nr:tetratricopeptide repeat protein [Arenicella xantha]RBP51472.1 lipopolysaccharide biosynthesis regulator YciM [Arenicella xantha]